MASIRISAPYMIAAGAIWPPVCGAIIGLRFATRRAQRGYVGVDDWLVLPALLCLTGMGAAAIAGTALKSVAYPTPAFDPAHAMTEVNYQQRTTRIVYWLVELLQILTIGCIKLSAMFFYRRIFCTGGNKILSIATWIVIGIVMAWTCSFFWAIVFACNTHFSYNWSSLADQMKCNNTVAEQMGLAISDFLTDLLILLFPIPLIWRLHIRTRKKVAVTGIFFLGTLAIAASITRMVIFVQALSAEFASTTDEDLLSTAGIYCMLIEAGLGLSAICLPSLSGALRIQAFQNLIDGFSSIFSSRHSRSSGSVVTSSPSNSLPKPYRLASASNSEQAAFAVEGNKTSAHSFEMKPGRQYGDEGIQVTREVDVRGETI